MRLLVVVAVLLSAVGAQAGFYMEHEAVLPNPVDMTKTMKQTMRSWHDGKRFKRDNPLGETIIIDIEKGEVYGVNAAKKTYWKMPVEKYRQLALLSLVVMGVKLGPDGSPVVPDPMFAETGATATIEGRKAVETKVAAELPMGVQTSIWVSKDVPAETAQLVEQMRVSLGNPKGAAYESLFRQWGTLPGYPVQNVTTITLPNKVVITTSETLLSIQEKPIDAAEFKVPKGYALVTDPVTELERQAASAAQTPLGIGAPLAPPKASPVTGQPKPLPTKPQ